MEGSSVRRREAAPVIDLTLLDTIDPGSRLAGLTNEQLTVVQRGLSLLCYPVRSVDGEFGPRTRNAWAEFVMDCGEGDPEIVSGTASNRLKERGKPVLDLISFPAPDTQKVKRAIAELCSVMGLPLKPQVAYVLATAQWETNHTFKPVKEAYWLTESWRKTHLHYYPYYGRGYVQLTWKRNYELYGSIFDEKLAQKPDLARTHEIALFVLVHGFKLGTFTGRRLEEFVNESNADFLEARRCINGKDKREEIAEIATDILQRL